MNKTTASGDRGPEAQPSTETLRRPRWWALAGGAAMVAFVTSVVLSTGSSPVPVGASGSMSGMSMSMSTGRLAVTMRDVDDRTIRVPDGRPGVVVFAEPRGCDSCIDTARAARDAVQRAVPRAQLIVVMLDPATALDEVSAFARSVGRSPARYVVDDRNSSLASMLGASRLGGAIVYDALGRIVARPGPVATQVALALRRAQT